MDNPFEHLQIQLNRIEEKLDRLMSDKEKEPKFKDVMNVKEASKYLKIPEGTIYQKVSTQSMPFKKFPGEKRLKFIKEEIDVWDNLGRPDWNKKKHEIEVDKYLSRKNKN